MRRTLLRLTKAKIKRGRRYQRYYCVVVPKPGRGRTRHFFTFSREGKQEAETFLEMCKQQQLNYGTVAFSITEALRAEAMDCVSKLSAVGRTLTDAVKFFLEHLDAQQKSISVDAAIEQLVTNRSKAGLSVRYCHDLRLRLGRFAKDFGDRSIATITAAQIDSWLAALPVGPGTRNTFRRDLRTLWSYCEKHGYCKTNEAKKTQLARNVEKPPGILTVRQT